MRLAFQDNIQEYNQERGLSVTESCLTPKENKKKEIMNIMMIAKCHNFRSIHIRQGDHE